MKKIMIATALLAGFTLAATPKDSVKVDTAKKIDTVKIVKVDTAKKIDTVKKVVVAPKIDTAKIDSFLAAHKAKVDSLFAELKKNVPDSLKAKVDTAAKGWKLADTAKSTKTDSLRSANVSKRDTLISKIKDTAAAAKIKARIADLEADKTALKAKLDARKAALDAKLADIKKNKK